MDIHDENNSTVYYVKAENALRFILTDRKAVSIELMDGFAEIFGTELVKGKLYTFLSPAYISLFTWQGCSVKFYGQARKVFLESHSSMFLTAYIHACLEERRIKAESENKRGPICLVIGKRDTGKSSFSRILVNYAIRQGRCPLYVDLDVDQNWASLPGTMNMLIADKQGDVIEGFNHKVLSVYSFGYTNPNCNIPLYLLLVKELGQKAKNLFTKDNNQTYFSGAIIDTFGWMSSEGYAAAKITASAFDVDVIFVINDKDTCLRLRKQLSRVEVVLIPIEDARERRKIFRTRSRDNCIFDYFYGLKTPLNPHTFIVSFNEIEIYKIMSAATRAKFNAISLDDINVIKVPFDRSIIYHILSLSYCDTADKNLATTNIMGFVCVIDVCLEKQCVTLLSPRPYPLPGRILIMGNVKLK